MRTLKVLALMLVAGLVTACATPSRIQRIASPALATDSMPGGHASGPVGPVEVLSQYAHYELAADGTKTQTYRLRYRVVRLKDLRSWASVSGAWSPWYQDRPELSATVTRPNGTKIELDPETIIEGPLKVEGSGATSGRRKVQARLPGLEPGAIVEQTIVVRDREPLLTGGTMVRAALGLGAPVRSSVLEVVLPRTLALRYQVRGIALDPVQTDDAEQVTLRFEARDLPAYGPTRMLLPPEHPRYAHIVLSTLPSWKAAGGAYAKLVKAQLKGSDVSALLKGLDKQAPKAAIVSELLKRIHGEIRDMPQPFGQQPILPAAPAETLARRAGDSKDKGALFVALLKGAGIKAHLALLRAGKGEDIAEGLPGVDAFNHSLVYMPDLELWVDVTEPLLPAGELPMHAQGRMALVAASAGPGLVRVPEAAPSHNAYVEVRTVSFADWGPVRVLEKTEATGTMQHRLRRQLLGSGRDRVRNSLSGYVQRTYRADRLGRFEYGNLRDVDTPFTVQVEALDANIGYTGREAAKLQLRTPVLFGFVPELLRDAALGMIEEDPSPERQAAAQLIATRRTDLMLPQGFRAEVRYQIELPDGFEVKTSTRSLRVPLGPGTYEVQFSPPQDGLLVVALKLSVTKRRLSSDEAREFTKGLSEVWQMDLPTLELEHIAARLMRTGRAPEALKVHRSLIQEHGEPAVHRARYAESLLAAGLGAAAREQARAAVKEMPQAAHILMTLGRMLEHDTYGRPRAAGFVRAEAMDVFRRVLALDREHIGARLSVARLLELDDQAKASTDPASWAKAAEAYRTLRDQTGDTEFDLRLMHALLEGGDFEGLHRLASKLPTDAANVAMQVVAAAQTRGAKLAIAEIDALELSAGVRTKALETASIALARARAYGLARDIMKAALQSSADPDSLRKRWTNLEGVEAISGDSLGSDSPEGVVRQLLYLMLSPPVTTKALRQVFSARAFDGADLGSDLLMLTEGLSAVQRRATRSEVPLTMVRDNILSRTTYEVSGSPSLGYRVQASMTGGSGPRQNTWFVVPTKRGHRIRASGATPAALGEEALHYLHLGNVKAARQWLSWAEALLPDARGEQDGLKVAPFTVLRASKAPLTVQGAALAALGPRAPRFLKHLEGARRVIEAPKAKVALQHALWMALARDDRLEQAALLSEALLQAEPQSQRAVGIRCQSLVLAKQYGEARRFAQARRRTNPNDDMALACLGDQALAEGDLDKARAWMQQQVEAGQADSTILNNLAWLSLFVGEVTDADLEASVKSNSMTGFSDPSKLHTLAALHAERGDTQQAHKLFVKRLELRGADSPEAVDWYLLGRIMEHYELFDRAEAAYRRVVPEARAVDSTHRLAQQRLKVLQAR